MYVCMYVCMYVHIYHGFVSFWISDCVQILIVIIQSLRSKSNKSIQIRNIVKKIYIYISMPQQLFDKYINIESLFCPFTINERPFSS